MFDSNFWGLCLTNVTYFVIFCQYLVLSPGFLAKIAGPYGDPAAVVNDMGNGIFVDFSRSFYLI
jgi:hypothetical protein